MSLRQATRQKRKDNFLDIASHELKTPITSIKAFTQILKERIVEGNTIDSAFILDRIDNQINKLTNLIDKLVDVACIETNQMEYSEDLIEVGDLVREITTAAHQLHPTHQIITRISVDHCLYADRFRISQALNTLISNAIKYSPEADKIIVFVEQNESDLIFNIQDFGIGIINEMQKHIFDNPLDPNASVKDTIINHQLNLYITSQIIQQHGGKIWLKSEPGKGSLFSFSLPFKM
jgi:K+-sensing histidine kinase KdpD